MPRVSSSRSGITVTRGKQKTRHFLGKATGHTVSRTKRKLTVATVGYYSRRILNITSVFLAINTAVARANSPLHIYNYSTNCLFNVAANSF